MNEYKCIFCMAIVKEWEFVRSELAGSICRDCKYKVDNEVTLTER